MFFLLCVCLQICSLDDVHCTENLDVKTNLKKGYGNIGSSRHDEKDNFANNEASREVLLFLFVVSCLIHFVFLEVYLSKFLSLLGSSARYPRFGGSTCICIFKPPSWGTQVCKLNIYNNEFLFGFSFLDKGKQMFLFFRDNIVMVMTTITLKKKVKNLFCAGGQWPYCKKMSVWERSSNRKNSSGSVYLRSSLERQSSSSLMNLESCSGFGFNYLIFSRADDIGNDLQFKLSVL